MEQPKEKETEPVDKTTATGGPSSSHSKGDRAEKRLQPIKIVFLGTSSGAPTVHRNVSATLLCIDPQRYWLVDCGEGTQHQILKVELSFTRIEKIFITHLHGDHCLGLPGLLAMRTMKQADTPVEIFGPCGIKSLVENALRITQTFIPYSISFHELSDYESMKSFDFGSRDGWTISAHPLTHRVPCWGYVFTEDPLPGRFLNEKALEFGVPRGPILGDLAKGKVLEWVHPTTGVVLNRNDCLGPSLPGRKVVILGDTCDSSRISAAATDCDVLVHEATFHSSLKDRAIYAGHSTGPMAGEFAKSIRAKRLILTHFSMRHSTPGCEFTVDDILNETREVFSGKEKSNSQCTLIAANDLMSIDIAPRTWSDQKH